MPPRAVAMTGLASLAALEGPWLLDRVVTHSDGTEHRLLGRAEFRRSGVRLVHDEEGILTGDGMPPVRATRRYIWRAEPGRLECAFPDNRPFHTIPLGVERPETTYLCPPDRYVVSYDFADAAEWRSTWRVTGPRKDYRMVSTYRRAT